jgi:hypothetical protein
MEELSNFLVNKPMHILIVSSVYFLVWIVLRFFKSRMIQHPNAILVPAVFALIYAGWEWLVITETPGANIRFDLLLIWPLQAILSIWALIKTFRQ